jgi:hypothetical protein
LSSNQQFIKLFLIILISTGFVFSMSHFGAAAFDNSNTSNEKFSSGTTIGFLDVSGKNKNEVASLVEEKYVDWLKNTKLTLQYQEKSVSFNLDLFHLNSKQTVDSIKDGIQNSAFITIENSMVEEQLQNLFPQIKSADFDINKLTGSLIDMVSKFQKGTFTLNLYNDFLLTDLIKKDTVISTTNVVIKDVPEDLQVFIDNAQNIEIPSEGTFSLLGFVNEKKVNVQPETLNIIATGIYQAILPSNLTFVERNISNLLPNYAKLGFEAKVNKETKEDLVFSNPNKEKCYLDLQLDNNKFIVTLKGEKLFYSYKLSKSDEEILKPKTIIQYSPLILPGKIKVQNSGANGQSVKIYRDIYQGYKLFKSEFISEDYYPPAYRVEIHALAGGVNTVTEPTSTQSDNSSNTTSTTNSTNDTTNSTLTDTQPVSNETNLWGNPNEQSK